MHMIHAVGVLSILALCYLLVGPGYIPIFPHAALLYPDSAEEAADVGNGRTNELDDLFHLTDKSISPGFSDILTETQDQINSVANRVTPIVTILKVFINRPRPYQVSETVRGAKLASTTAHTPAFPSGHSTQAHVVAKHYSRKYPDKKEELYERAELIGQSRISAGLHYPSDHEMAKRIVEYFF